MAYNIGLVSLGCDKNRVDSEVMLSILSKAGYKIVNDEREADVIIINTCGFIESAKAEAIETILEMAKYKNGGKCKGLIVTGCLSQRYGNELIKEMPEIDAILGTGCFNLISDTVNNILENKKTIINIGSPNFDVSYIDRIVSTPKHYAYIKIADGCSNYCSFCIIPKIRGKFRSRRIEEIVKEANILASNGVKEIILVAQDTTMYGIDLYGKKSLIELLEQLEAIKGIEWIRIMYSYPEAITNELINKIKNSHKICHYFDIPLQHINDDILKKMRRRTTKMEIEELINKIRREIPDAVIRTSIIVGFPGETETEFNELKEFLEEYKLERVGVFAYSREEDTDAAVMLNQVGEDIKEERKEILMKQQRQICKINNESYLGNVLDVIIDSKLSDGRYVGRTYGDAPDIDQMVTVNADGRNYDTGSIIKVKITKAFFYDLMGDVLNESGK